MARLVKNDTKNLLLVNVWATWCGPCVAELPELVEINRMYRGRGFRLATISLDDASKRDQALEMLKEKHVSAMNYLSKLESQDKLAEALDQEWPGPVPYSILIAPGGKVLPARTQAGDRRPPRADVLNLRPGFSPGHAS